MAALYGVVPEMCLYVERASGGGDTLKVPCKNFCE